MTYRLCKRVITNNDYTNQEDYDDIMVKLDIFLLSDRLTNKEYGELSSMARDKFEGKI